MPILVPADPLLGEGVRAKRAVWEVLRDQLPDEAVLIHSLRLQERQNKYEADIVVLIPGVDERKITYWKVTALDPEDTQDPLVTCAG